ncbi:hypothetical protein SANTM175S_03455 [Streptomyces antimycoticus]
MSPAWAPVTPGVSGSPKVAPPLPGRGEERVDVPVVTPGELDHLGAPGEPAGQADRRHRRLGAARHQAHLLDGRDPRHDLLGELDLTLTGCAERRAASHGGLHGRDDLGVGMAEDHRSPRAHEIHILASVGIGEVRTVTGHHEPGRSSHGAERPHRRVHAAGGHGGRAIEKRLRNWGFMAIGQFGYDLLSLRRGGQ